MTRQEVMAEPLPTQLPETIFDAAAAGTGTEAATPLVEWKIGDFVPRSEAELAAVEV